MNSQTEHPKQQVNPHCLGEEQWQWIQKHQNDNTTKLRLKFGLNDPYFSAIAQIEARQKRRKKFETLYERWVFPNGLALEQSSSTAAAQYKNSHVHTPYTIDLCAGLGIDTWAMSSRQDSAAHLCFEQNEDLAILLRHNLPNITVLSKPADLEDIDHWVSERGITKRELTIYLDPDRRVRDNRTYSMSEGTPNLLEIQHELLNRACHVMAKHSPMVDLNSTTELIGLTSIVVVQFQGECKEVLTLQSSLSQSKSSVQVIDIDSGRSYSGELGIKEIATTEHFLNYIVQPSAGLSKSTLHIELAKELGLEKTIYGHLYTCENEPIYSPFYKIFRIEEISKPYQLKHKPSYAAIECIGFPESAIQVRKKLKLKEGRENKVFALQIGKTKLMVLATLME